jgi:predicted secreted protein
MLHQVTMNHHGQTLQVSAGDTIELQLEENPTTGYSWAIDQIDPLLRLDKTEYELLGGVGMGGGGMRRMLLKVDAPGNGRLRLKNHQPWSGDVYQTFALDVKTS